MTLSLLALAILALVIVAFVLEPILRARPERVVLDAATLSPRGEQPTGDDELLVRLDEHPAVEATTTDS